MNLPSLRTVAGVLKNLALVSRSEYLLVEMAIFALPLLAAAPSAAALLRWEVLEGALLFLILFKLGDVINCLADRDLDRTYKGRLSRAVHDLGVGRLTCLAVAGVAVSVLLAAHLAWLTGRWAILGLVLVELVLGIQYSVGPIHFKTRGVLQLPCLWAILLFLPMLCAALLVQEALTGPVVLFAASYGVVSMGVVLVNTSEDLPEDVAMGLTTITVALGLRRTLNLAAAMVLLGGAAYLGVWAYLYWPVGVFTWKGLALLALLAAWGYSLAVVGRLAARVNGARSEGDAVRLVKAHAWLVPVSLTLLGCLGLACGVLRLVLRGA